MVVVVWTGKSDMRGFYLIERQILDTLNETSRARWEMDEVNWRRTILVQRVPNLEEFCPLVS